MRRATLGALAAALGVVLACWVALHARPEGNPAVVRVQIVRGTGPDSLVSLLIGKGLAPRPFVTRWALRLEGGLEHVQAGIYEIPGDANALEVAAILVRPPRHEHVVLRLTPGDNLWQAGQRLEALGVGAASELAALAADRGRVVALVGDAALVGPERPARPDGAAPTYLEGFLSPDTYFVRPDSTTEATARRLVAQFRRVWDPLAAGHRADLMALQALYRVSPREVLIMASLIEKEAADRSEGPRIAGVFYNRLQRRMRLQTDPTLVYHPDRVGAKPTPAHRRDRTNPYNTYAHDRLPPGPICNPGPAALRAAMQPERHDLLYFVARRDGTGRHAFARTYEEHRGNVRRFLR